MPGWWRRAGRSAGQFVTEDKRRVHSPANHSLDSILDDPAPVCHLVAFGDSSLDFVVRFWIYDPEGGTTNIKGSALLAIWDVLKIHDIAIPYPHMTVVRRMPGQSNGTVGTNVGNDPKPVSAGTGQADKINEI